MITKHGIAAGWAALAWLVACTETGAIEVAVPLEVAGTRATAPILGTDGWEIDLTRVDVAFGPLHLCGGDKAGDLCDTARVEWIGSVVIDALDPAPRRAGLLDGTSGVVRSWMYDHAITSLLTQQEPLVLDAAEALDGSSIVIDGIAHRDGVAVTFHARIPIQREEEETEIGQPLVRKSGSDEFLHDITGDEARLLVRFDPRPWLGDIDFSALTDAEVTFPPESQGLRAIRNAVVAGQRPTFTWE